MKKYEQYKKSNISWLGVVPEHWTIKRIKYVFEEKDRRSETGKEDLLSVSQYTGITRKSDKVEEGESISNAKTLEGYKVVEIGDLVINIMLAWNGSLGISNYNGITSPAYCVYRNLEGYEKYFGYLFKTKNAQQEFKKQSTGIIDSRLRMYTDSFFNIKTVLPPLSEQTTIANFLDYKTEKINRFITKKKQLIKLLKEQKEAIINDMVTGKKVWNGNSWTTPDEVKDSGIEWLGDIPVDWEVKKLKYVANCFPSNVDKHKREDEKEVRLCNYTDVYKNDFIINDMDFMVATAKADQIKKFSLRVDDVIITKDSETADDIANPALVIEELDNVICGYHLTVMRPYSMLVGQYLLRLLQCKPINIQFEVRSNGVTRVGLGVYDTINSKVLVPTIKEQHLISNHINEEFQKIDKTISTIEKEIALVEEYRTALIAEAVTGKIDVRGWEIPEGEKVGSEVN